VTGILPLRVPEISLKISRVITVPYAGFSTVGKLFTEIKYVTVVHELQFDMTFRRCMIRFETTELVVNHN